jgi:hypothetical protein
MPRGRTPVSRQPGSPVVGDLSVHPPQEPAAPFRATCPVGSGPGAGQNPTLDDAPLARPPERQESANQRQRRLQGRYVNDPDRTGATLALQVTLRRIAIVSSRG